MTRQLFTRQRSTAQPLMAFGAEMRRLIIPDGTVEALKWLALVSMTIDHLNKYIWSYQYPWMYEFGRLAMPLFGFVLAYNLARPYAVLNAVHQRAMVNMLLFGLMATPAFMQMTVKADGYSLLPLNIMFTLLAVAGTIFLIERGRLVLAALVVLTAGLVVEYWWFGLAYCVAAWAFCKYPARSMLLVWLAATAGLAVVNQNFWALLVFPVVMLASHVDIRLPRLRYLFYAYYPLHLLVLWAIRRWLQMML